ncbi:MAG: hypothetical protein ABIR18_08310, partial [Chitinophagaceae bacterium]
QNDKFSRLKNKYVLEISRILIRKDLAEDTELVWMVSHGPGVNVNSSLTISHLVGQGIKIH